MRQIVVVVVSGIQPTPIGWVIISSGAGNHCEKSRDDSVYKPMTTDGHFLLRFLSKQNKNLLLISNQIENMASSLAYGSIFTAFKSTSGKPSFYALFVFRNVKLPLLI